MGGQPSPLRSALRLVAERARRRGGAAVPESQPRRRVAVECGPIRVEPRQVRRYLAATGGTGIAALEAEDAPLPPTYPALWVTALTLDVLSHAGLPIPTRGIVHLESEMVRVRPLRGCEHIRCRAELDRVEPHPRGRVLRVKARTWNAAGQLCQEDGVAMLLREGSTGARRAPRREAEPSPPAEWRTLAEWGLRSGQGRRYARVSGDFNPIHLWGWSARLLGFRRPILHGFCTQAMIAHALIRHHLEGDPAALRRLRVRFRAPLLLPARVRLQLADERRLRLVDAAEGGRVYVEGEFVGVRG